MKIELTGDDLAIIERALVQLPFCEVVNLMSNLGKQIESIKDAGDQNTKNEKL